MGKFGGKNSTVMLKHSKNQMNEEMDEERDMESEITLRLLFLSRSYIHISQHHL